MVYLPMKKIQVDLPQLMVNLIAKFTEHELLNVGSKTITLPYVMFLTQVFCYFGMNFNEEETLKILGIRTNDSTSPRYMSYIWDEQKKGFGWLGSTLYLF